MTRSGRLGFLLCLLVFIAICVLTLGLTNEGPFGGIRGLESNLATQAAQQFETTAPNTQIVANGQDLTVTLPDRVTNDFDRAEAERNVRAIKGVRSVTFVGDPSLALPDDRPAETPATATPAAEPDTPAPVETPDVEPTETPASVEPTAEPDEEPPSVSPADQVAALDLSGVIFEPGTAQLTGVDRALLASIAGDLDGLDGVPVEVQAHTDNLGDPDVNLLLSQDRAQAVVDYLTDRGVTADLTARGYGASLPIADNSTEEGRDTNQRVALVVEGN